MSYYPFNISMLALISAFVLSVLVIGISTPASADRASSTAALSGAITRVEARKTMTRLCFRKLWDIAHLSVDSKSETGLLTT